MEETETAQGEETLNGKDATKIMNFKRIIKGSSWKLKYGRKPKISVKQLKEKVEEIYWNIEQNTKR